MKILIVIAILLCLAVPCMAVPVSYSWNASTGPSTPDNPIKYKLYLCSDSTLTQCIPNDAGTSTTLTVQMNSGNYWAYVVAWNYAVTADNPDGPYTGVPVESDKSNVVATRVSVPPGNPGNFKVRLQ